MARNPVPKQTKKAARQSRTKRITNDQIAEALHQTGGIALHAAQMLGCAPNTIKNRIAKSKSLQKVSNEVTELNLDLAESQLLKGIRDGDKTYVIFYLKTKGKDRGYVERQEATGKDGGPVQTQGSVVRMPSKAESGEAWAAEHKPAAQQ